MLDVSFQLFVVVVDDDDDVVVWCFLVVFAVVIVKLWVYIWNMEVGLLNSYSAQAAKKQRFDFDSPVARRSVDNCWYSIFLYRYTFFLSHSLFIYIYIYAHGLAHPRHRLSRAGSTTLEPTIGVLPFIGFLKCSQL